MLMLNFIFVFVLIFANDVSYQFQKAPASKAESACQVSLASTSNRASASFWPTEGESCQSPQQTPFERSFVAAIKGKMDSYPWHCSCGRLNGKRHTHCPTCHAHWSVGTPHSNAPKSPRARQHVEDQQSTWNWPTGRQPSRRGRKNQNQSSYYREDSLRRGTKGSGKGNPGKGSQVSPFATQSSSPAIPPWPSPETSTTLAQSPVVPSLTAASHAELLTAVRKQYPDISQAPEDIQKAVEKSDKATTKVLTTDLNKASKQVGKAARQLATLKDARAAHRQNWLKHLRDSVVSWQKQLQLFKDQQKDYSHQMERAQQELTTARRHLQNLNKQAAAIGAPISSETGEANAENIDMDNSTFEAQAQALVLQVQESLQQSIAAASAGELQEVSSDEEMDRKNKRQRSMEPFGGTMPQMGGQGDMVASSPPS